jgi:hypothetical protein
VALAKWRHTQVSRVRVATIGFVIASVASLCDVLVTFLDRQASRRIRLGAGLAAGPSFR